MRTARIAFLAALAWSSSALAQGLAPEEPPREKVALSYNAPAECPADGAFRAAVRARVAAGWEAEPGELARKLSVTVTRGVDGYVAAIDFLNPEGERVTRSVTGHVCADVVDGIALVTALAIQSRVEPEVAPEAPPASKPPAPAKTPAVIAPVASRRTRSPPSSRPMHVRLGAGAVGATGVGDQVAFGTAVFAGLAWAGPRVGLTGEALWSGREVNGGVPARYRRLSGRLDACPLALDAESFALEPCAFFRLGALHGEGLTDQSLARTGGGASLWADGGLLARGLAFVGPLAGVLEVTGGVPLSRERFGVVTGTQQRETFRVPRVVGGVMLGLALRL